MSRRGEQYSEFEEERHSNNNSFVSSALSKDSENLLLGRLFKVGIGLIFPPIVIISCSIYAYFQTVSQILLIPIFVSVFALISAVLLVYLCRNNSPSTQATNFIFYCIYLIHFIASCYFLIGIVLVFLFGFKEDLPALTAFAILCIEGACLKYIIGYALLSILSRKLLIERQSIRNYLEIIQVSLLICGLGICMTCLAYQSNWENLDLSYHLPPVILDLGITTGACLIVLSIALFTAAYSEKLSLLLLCQILTIVMLIFLFLYSAMVRYSSSIYNDTIKNNCSYILKILNENLLTCEKYVETQCDKEYFARVWERDLEGNTEMCLEGSCCDEIEEKITLGLEFLMIWSMLGCILLGFSWMAGQGLVKKIEKFGRSVQKSFDIKLLSLVLGLCLLGFAGWFTLVNEQQIIYRNSAYVNVKNGGIVDSKYVPSSLCQKFSIKFSDVENFSSVTLYSEFGTFSPNKYMGKPKNFQDFLSKSVFCPNYPQETYEISLIFEPVLNKNIENDQEITNKMQNFTILSAIISNSTIIIPYQNVNSLEFHSNIHPNTLINKTEDTFEFTVPVISHAYNSILSFDGNFMTITVGGLHANAIPIQIPCSSQNISKVSIKIVGETLDLTQIFVSTGFNNFTSPFLYHNITENEKLTISLSTGPYTIYTKRKLWGSAVRNFFLGDSPEEVTLLHFPKMNNIEFSTVLTSSNSELYGSFQLTPKIFCNISLSFPRCGGSRLIHFKEGEILITSEINSSPYLIYAVSDNFTNDTLTFYPKNSDFPMVYLQGKNNAAGVWLLYCLDGTSGVNSLKVLDLYISSEDLPKNLNICEKNYKK